MVVVPVAVVDALISLLEAEQQSVFRLMGEQSPYLRQAPPDVQQSLDEIAEVNARHCAQLTDAIEGLGGSAPPRGPGRGDQYLAFLSLKFLLPKLADELELTIRRYDNTLRAIGKVASPQVLQMLDQQQAEQRAQLAVLRQKAEDVIAASR